MSIVLLIAWSFHCFPSIGVNLIMSDTSDDVLTSTCLTRSDQVLTTMLPSVFISAVRNICFVFAIFERVPAP